MCSRRQRKILTSTCVSQSNGKPSASRFAAQSRLGECDGIVEKLCSFDSGMQVSYLGVSLGAETEHWNVGTPKFSTEIDENGSYLRRI